MYAKYLIDCQRSMVACTRSPTDNNGGQGDGVGDGGGGGGSAQTVHWLRPSERKAAACRLQTANCQRWSTAAWDLRIVDGTTNFSA
ncbi:GD24964 [Drosophila simulans]|uniref:GD24964 n=1 Tax=Drosophila simulans TaxID=7240 RepID=B4QBX5_DROSI|nr:GD24964 [Drosophila simulans]